jgi:hypothetical protein
LRGKRAERLGEHRRAADDDQRGAARGSIPTRAVCLAQAATRTIPSHGILELSAHGEPCTRRLRRLTPEHNERGPVDPSASLEKRLKLGAGGQPLASGKATR